jgi:hypothetical protein
VRRRLAAALLAALACAPLAAAAPSADDLRAERDALALRDASLERRIERGQGALAADRGRLDRARADHRRALSGFERRLRALYVSPDPSPVIEVLTGGDLDDAQARIDLLSALGRSDRELVDRYRRSAAELRAAEADMRRDKDALVREREQLSARLEAAQAALRAAERREERARREATAAAALPVLGGLAVTPSFGVPVAAPAAGSAADTPARGLPAELIAARGLPGEAPRDATTGQAVDTAPAGPGPATTRAYPRLGAVGPAAGGALPSRLPTFTAVAGWYGPGFTRARLASGEAYDPAAFSAASRTLRLGTLLRIAYGARVVTVRVNDRGPYVRGRDLELSQAAAAALGLPGVGTVTAQILPAYSPPSRVQ